MNSRLAGDLFLGVAAIPFIYYSLALFSSWRFFRQSPEQNGPSPDFTPPVSNLKPVRGLDPGAYENFASFCRQDYPDYELIFCVGDKDDEAVPLLEKLARDFPQPSIRIIYSGNHTAVNDKVAKLGLLVAAARHEVLVINDADVRVQPDYLRSVVAPLRDPKVGGVTCLYVSVQDHNFLQRLQSMAMICDFYPGILVDWQLEGTRFALGQTTVTTRARIAGFGGYKVLENRPADDLLVGRFIGDQGYKVELLNYAVQTVPDFQSGHDLLLKRLRWMTVMRHMRPWGHIGLLFTFGLPWSLMAMAVRPTATIAAAYLGGYLAFRLALTWLIGAHGLKQKGMWKKMPLIPVWDGFAFFVWIASFTRKTIRWGGVDFWLRKGTLVPVVKQDGSR